MLLADVSVGFGEADITPDLTAQRPVWMAGFGMGRQATGVHDPLMARCVVLRNGDEKVALVSVDLVGLQYPTVREVRERLQDYRYVLVASTHNHEGPDVIGIWGPSPVRRGVDDEYLKRVVDRCEQAVRAAERHLSESRVHYGTAADESLLGDSREPFVKDGVLRVLKFTRTNDESLAGVLVQWSCHPESLGKRNTLITADFPHYTVAALQARYRCPVAYFSGAVGGLMSNPDGIFRDAAGQVLPDGNFEYCRQYGEAVAQLAGRAIDAATPARLTPFHVSTRSLGVPVDNQYYRAAQELGVIRRSGRPWEGEGADGRPIMAVETEVGYLRLGDVHLVLIPGELYPELVYGKVQDPADPGADFPGSPIEPSITELVPSSKWLVFGLANDEIGYIIPRRQWDEKPPYCYGRNRAQYGEINSCGPLVAPIIMGALRELTGRVAE
jgi:hypothetical protein